MTLPIASLSHHGFWSSTAGVALVVALCALVVGGTVALMLMRRFKRASVRDRVGQFVSSELATPTEVVEDDPETVGMFARTERSIERERWLDDFRQKLEIARIERSPVDILFLTLAASLG